MWEVGELTKMVKSIPNKSERGGNIYDFIGMAKEGSVPRDEGINQNIEYLDYMNKVPKSDRTKQQKRTAI